MRVYLDTEFADWDDPDTDLISIALVSEDGHELDYDGDWALLVRLLGKHAPAPVTFTNICRELNQRKLEEYYIENRVPTHYALHDARANRWARR